MVVVVKGGKLKFDGGADEIILRAVAEGCGRGFGAPRCTSWIGWEVDEASREHRLEWIWWLS
jgi:hypothetical protein